MISEVWFGMMKCSVLVISVVNRFICSMFILVIIGYFWWVGRCSLLRVVVMMKLRMVVDRKWLVVNYSGGMNWLLNFIIG